MTDFHVSQAVLDQPSPTVTVTDVTAALAKARKWRRIILCSEDCAPELRRALRAEGLHERVTVMATPFLDEGVAYLIDPDALRL